MLNKRVLKIQIAEKTSDLQATGEITENYKSKSSAMFSQRLSEEKFRKDEKKRNAEKLKDKRHCVIL